MATKTELSKSENAKLLAALQPHYKIIEDFKTRTVDGMVEAGDALIAIRELLPHGEFLPAVAERGYSKSDAYRLIAVAEHLRNFPRRGNIDDEAVKLLASNSGAMEAAKARAAKGYRIMVPDAREFLEANKRRKPDDDEPSDPNTVDALSVSEPKPFDLEAAEACQDLIDARNDATDEDREASEQEHRRGPDESWQPTGKPAEPDSGEEAPKTTRPFAHLPAVPADVNDAFEAYKLCILRHKIAGWQDISRMDMLASLKALGELAKAPSA